MSSLRPTSDELVALQREQGTECVGLVAGPQILTVGVVMDVVGIGMERVVCHSASTAGGRSGSLRNESRTE